MRCVCARARREEAYSVLRPRAQRPKAALCLLIPTASYLAYANRASAFDAAVACRRSPPSTPIFRRSISSVYKNDEFGLSTYDHHSTARASATPRAAVRSSTSGRSIA